VSVPLGSRHEPGRCSSARFGGRCLGLTLLPLGLVFPWFSELLRSVTEPARDLGVLGCCCTNWYFAECIGTTQQCENRQERDERIFLNWQQPYVGVWE